MWCGVGGLWARCRAAGPRSARLVAHKGPISARTGLFGVAAVQLSGRFLVPVETRQPPPSPPKRRPTSGLRGQGGRDPGSRHLRPLKPEVGRRYRGDGGGFLLSTGTKKSYSRPRATRPTSGVHGEARGAATRGQAAAYRAHGSPGAVPCPSACSSGQQVGHAHRNRPWGCLGARWPRLGQPSVAVPYDPTHTQGWVLVASSPPGEPAGPLGWLLRFQGPGNRPYWRTKRPCEFRLPQGATRVLRRIVRMAVAIEVGPARN